jgi:2-polyprenyl-6-methoxyphenol hydroxylase-like FAD-dependent oxidoreductase
MPAVRRVVIVGGGICGLSLAIGLARAGIDVRVLEKSVDGNVLGIGMALQPAALRALDWLGLLQQCLEAGFTHETTTQFDLDGALIRSQPIPPPGQLGIQRKAFHRLLLDEACRLGVGLRFGTTVASVSRKQWTVELVLNEDMHMECDLVVGADGAHSSMRETLLASSMVPEFTGQATWRIGVPRPPEMRGMSLVLGGPLSVGINPVSDSEAYIFVVENVAERRHVPEPELLEYLPNLLRGYGGLIADLIATVDDPSAIVYRPLESLIMPPPWHAGRAVLVGDAAHTTTPHMAAGALIAIQDAVVMVDELLRETSVLHALQGFMVRRYERCKLLVESCRQVGEWQKAGRVRVPVAAQLQAKVMAALGETP